MKLSLVFTALASMVVLATAFPVDGAIAKRSYAENRAELLSNVGKREELDADHKKHPHGVEKREELDADHKKHPHGVEKREELDADHKKHPHGVAKREELDADHKKHPHGVAKREELDADHKKHPHEKREELDADHKKHPHGEEKREELDADHKKHPHEGKREEDDADHHKKHPHEGNGRKMTLTTTRNTLTRGSASSLTSVTSIKARTELDGRFYAAGLESPQPQLQVTPMYIYISRFPYLIACFLT
ncbi:hypothetical protein EV424DRAFT_230073 [Suillus variegatus]|nr:hypothetical protein EV424DRAFT_230073 [Suillus variegatus]